MKELWPLEYNKYIFLFYGETLPHMVSRHPKKYFEKWSHLQFDLWLPLDVNL